MGSFSNPEMQSWMPFILGGKKSMTDKLILMQYLQMAENQGKKFRFLGVPNSIWP